MAIIHRMSNFRTALRQRDAQTDLNLRKALPKLELTYTAATVDPVVHDVDAESLENLPEGLAGARGARR